MPAEKGQQIVFDDFTLDVADESLWKGSGKIHLRPKTFTLLQYLIAHPGQLVTKDKLLNVLWPSCNVGDGALKHCVAEIRKALNDPGEEPRIIETAHRRGYRFIAEITQQRTAGAVKWENLDRHNDESAFNGCQLVGRLSELAQLRQYLEKAISGVRQIVFVTGEQGIGKTTLVDAFLNLLEAERQNQDTQNPLKRLLITSGQCIKSHGAGEAYMPFREALTTLCSNSARKQVLAVLRTYAPLWLLQTTSLVSAAQLRSLRRMTCGATRQRMLREMTEALEALTEEAPLALVLEDLHWSDYSSIDLISYLAQRRKPARLLLVATYRPAEVAFREDHPLRLLEQELQARQLCQELPLSFLDEAAISEYLVQRFPGHKFAANTAAWLQQRTGGNPLFMINILDHLVARELILERDEQWSFRVALEEAELIVPQTIQQIIERQIEMCTPEERRLLQAGSVEGAEFSVDEIAAALGEKTDRIEMRCRKLAQRNQFIQIACIRQTADKQHKCYRFIHALYQNTCYQMMPAELQARLHRRIAEFIEESNRTDLGELAARLAMHFDRAKEYRRAIKYYQQAANNANSRYAGHEALVLARQGIELLEMIPHAPDHKEREICLQIELGRALTTAQGMGVKEADYAFSRARELFQELSKYRRSRKKALLFSALSGLCGYHWARAECKVARELGEQMLQLAEAERDASMLDQAHASLGMAMLDLGEFASAFRHLEQCKSTRSSCHAEVVRWHLGYVDQALNNLESTLARALETNKPEEYISAHLAMAWLHVARWESKMALVSAQAAIDLALHHAFGPQVIAPMKVIQGWAMGKLGQVSQGFEQVRQALDAFRDFGSTNLKPLVLMVFADTSLDAGQIEQGLAAVEEALDLAHRSGLHACDAEIYRLKGELLWQQSTTRGDTQYPEVEYCFEQAIKVARQQKAKWYELRATTSLARLLQKQNRKAEARERLSKIHKLITEGHNIPDMQRARKMLQELS